MVTVGESLGLVRAARPGGLRHVRDARIGFGGAESNAAIGLSRLGVDTTWIGRLGTDPLGDLVEAELRAEAVRPVVVRDPGRPTALMLKDHRIRGSSQVRYYRRDSAGSALSVDDLPHDVIEAADHLHLTGITPALSDGARRAVFAALEIAEAGGLSVSFDVNHRPALWSADQARGVYTELAGRADVVFAGQDEAELLTGGAGGPTELARRVRELGAGEVVVKLGDRGCIVSAGDSLETVPAVRVDVVDTVGAGDAFVAGYLAAAFGGRDPAARARLGATAGAFACLTDGDWEGCPRTDELGLVGAADPVTR
ncbi:sugar kinase [Pseudonocardia nematodicida]|uniref:Sugar kinase n=1 Tax=Pseudonocardia nematodicida TaxID=1206997 RepID=A0ABV1KEH0_9PSEU